MKKAEARILYKEKRNVLSLEEISSLSNQIVAQYINFFNYSNQSIHLFLPIKKHKEIDTFPLIKIVQSQGNQTIVSKSDFTTHQMTHLVFDESSILMEDDFGIPTPINGEIVSSSDLNIVFVPLLLFDEKGYRTGYGKGFYDRFLAECPTVIKIGLSLFPPISLIEDINSFDIPLNYCITPNKVFQF